MLGIMLGSPRPTSTRVHATRARRRRSVRRYALGDMSEDRATVAAEGGRDSPASIIVQRRIEWSDTDASGAYHNTAAFRFMEAAEAALLERLGFIRDIYGRHPRVRMEADFPSPLWFRDLVDVELTVQVVGRTSITYACEIRRGDEICVKGRMIAVLLDHVGGTAQPWPERYREAFLTAGPQPPERLG